MIYIYIIHLFIFFLSFRQNSTPLEPSRAENGWYSQQFSSLSMSYCVYLIFSFCRRKKYESKTVTGCTRMAREKAMAFRERLFVRCTFYLCLEILDRPADRANKWFIRFRSHWVGIVAYLLHLMTQTFFKCFSELILFVRCRLFSDAIIRRRR